ncbi:pilus assembly protein N-terminal domain-containing protein [Terrarubrum flagellatum]|uniref:pilus assembly protein N-terminal domain-containing protein n=1 Tax=Terrirubrum flagellatum TaxID=2895980 RepID=UPI0031450653
MPHSGRAIGIILAATLFAAGAAQAADEVVSVVLNQARILRLPEKARTIVIGNPMIADVTMQKHGNLVLTGKGYGSTNLIALDDKGAIVAESRIRVEAAQDSTLVVLRGMERESYSCSPQCQPTSTLGDSNKFFEEAGNQIDKRNNWASPK